MESLLSDGCVLLRRCSQVRIIVSSIGMRDLSTTDLAPYRLIYLQDMSRFSSYQHLYYGDVFF